MEKLRLQSNTHVHPVVEWLLLTGNRGIIALGLTGLFAVFFTVLGFLGAVPLRDMQALFYAYSGLISGNITLITVIVSINQLFLSRELQTPGELQTQIENIIEYRKEVEQTAGEVAPPMPLGFLRLLVEATRQNAQQVGGFAKDGVVTSGHEELDDVVLTITDRMDRIDTHLTGSDTDTFHVLSVMLETNYAQQIYKLRVIRAEHGDDIADVALEAINNLIHQLQDIDVSRQYFRTVYLQEELSGLSRYLLYAGLPSEAIAIAALLILTVPSEEPATVINLQLLLPVTLMIGLLPLAILCSFFLRTATVTKLTAATVPFTTPEDERL
ncbi:hypothetical protein [Natronococcus wangiae]|uniref:hypothetical protein n=1 Tax=Natronococcus wangiae TaxID=3068275 RepID=UPI00273E814E|nr:hypothetical protein [Natronococcus sp. AD5]